MANLTIRNLDDEVVKRLKKKAKDNGRSLEAELRLLLSEEAQRPSRHPSRGAELRARAERIAAMTPDVPQTDSVELLREDRDR